MSRTFVSYKSSVSHLINIANLVNNFLFSKISVCLRSLVHLYIVSKLWEMDETSCFRSTTVNYLNMFRIQQNIAINKDSHIVHKTKQIIEKAAKSNI